MLTTNSSLMDGINRHILAIATALNKIDNVEVRVCTVFPNGDLNKELAKNNIKTFSLDAKNGHELKIIPEYYKIIKSYAPDIIHVHVMSIIERIISSLFFRKIKYIKTIHGIDDNFKKVPMRMKMEKFINKIFKINFSSTIYISSGVKDALNNHTVKNPCVIYNTIELNAQKAINSNLHNILNLQEDINIVGTACRIAKQKQPQIFTDIMCQILKKDSKTHAVIIGDGEKEIIKECKNIIDNYGVKERFHWLGYRDDAPKLIKGLNCFILSSSWEGLPTSLLECMSMKVPFAFIEGDGGLKDIAKFNEAEGKFALTVSANEKDKLADEILDLIYDPIRSKEYTERAYMVAYKHFNIKNITTQLINIYKDLL